MPEAVQPGSARPGDVLARRYRLVDLLSEARGGRFWRAWDNVLARHVALHLIPEEDERAPELMEAARRSATLLDPHLLRVLDADQVDGMCFVVNEWGEGDSLDHLLVDGPLAPRRAAWVVSEVGELLAHAHEQGIAHGRLVPENVLIDEAGAVKVIGFAVDAALNGLPTGRIPTDVVDLAAVLYAALTGKWPGISRSSVPPAPVEHGRPLRPRQVRAGVPRVLDALCDEVLSPYPGPHDHGYDSARAITDGLREYVGDPGVLAEAEAAAHRRGGRAPGADTAGFAAVPADPEATQLFPAPPGASPAVPSPDQPEPAATGPEPSQAAPEPSPGEHPEPAPSESPAEQEGPSEPAAEQEPPSEPAAEPRPTQSPPHGEETQAGVPVFYEAIDDIGWMAPDEQPAPPPPAFEEPPPRPLFAPDPPGGRPSRVPRTDTDTGGTGAGYWPWDDAGGSAPVVEEDDEGDSMPGRQGLRAAAILAVTLLIVLAMVYAFNRGRDDAGDDQPGAETDRSPQPVRIAAVTDFDPQGDPPEEYPELAALAADGNPRTAWRTSTYEQDLGPGGLKEGVGLLLDLGRRRQVATVEITFVGTPTAVRLFGTSGAEPPTDLDGVAELASGEASTTTLTLRPEEERPSRWLVVWLTSLPDVGGFRGEVAEVRVRA